MLKRVGLTLKTLPLRHYGGASVSGLRSNFSGTERYNQAISDAGIAKTAGLGWGHLHPSTWLMPYKAGAVSSRNDSPSRLTVSSLNLAMGQNLLGATTLLIAVSGLGQAVASLAGVSNIVFTSSASLTAPFNMVASSSLLFTSSATLRADASVTGSASILVTPSLTTSAIGFMVAVPISTDLTINNVADAVWSASATSNNVVGTMGEKLNDAGSAGNPWAASLSTNNSPGTFGALVQKLMTVGKFLALK